MTQHRGLPLLLVPISCLVATAAVAQNPPEKALKYHEALLKRPHSAALFDRFFGAWIDEQPVETLDAFLKARAQANGGQEWTVLATYELRRGREDEALAALGKGIEAVPDDAALSMERAKLRLRRLEFAAAREDLAKVVAGKDEVLALEAAKLTGKSWLREGKTAEAIKAWDAVLAAHPGDEDLLEDLVETAAAESETAQALIYADKLVAASRDPYQKTLRMLRRGDLLAQAGRSDEAVEAYAGTLNQVGEGSWLEREVLVQIEKLFRKQDRLGDLAGQLKKLAETYPQRLLIHRQLAKLEATQGETDAAIGRFREVLKRSPGDRELREEFVRLLSDGERFDDAVAELEKLIELAPQDAGLYLQVAALRSRQNKPELVLAALKKAHELLGKDEGNGIRIAGLMLQYGLNEPGEALLKELAAGEGPAAKEALAAHYGRTNRKAEAIELLKKAGAGDDMEVLVRTSGAISALGENGIAFEILTARAEKFSAEPRFLAAFAQSALAAGKPADVVPQALKLVRLAKQTAEISESIGLASRVIAGAQKAEEIRAALAAQPVRSAAETCLLASLTEDSGDFVAVGKLLDPDRDPLVIHFHAALLSLRNEFDEAIAVLSRLADTDEGKKAAYFKDLAELQQRAGKTPEALATVERWKLAAPGDKTAWVTGSRLLRESGKPEEAVKMTRQAVARFEGDADLAASLAALHDEAGQFPDAEAIYWRLYDEGQSPADQARWAVQLAQLAMRTGKTEELDEKLRERARGNRRSLGPVLAQAELARVMNNEDKRRDLLLEAVRLQPKDVDLRLQIANLEEQSGNPDRVVAVLEEAALGDTTGRIRAALAQAYLRQGQVLKGMRELKAMSGKQANDPRAIESSAASLAGAGMYDEAIQFLREALPDGGDWRTKYLLAVMLEEDGREAEALPIFLDLQKAEGDLPGARPNPHGGPDYQAHYPEATRGLLRLTALAQTAYAHQTDRNHGGFMWGGGYMSGGGGSKIGPFVLPDDVESVRGMSRAHLGKLAKKGGPQVLARVTAAGVPNVEFVNDFIAASSGQNGPDYASLLKTYPTEPGLLEIVLMYSGYGGRNGKLDPETLGKVLDGSQKLSPETRFRAASLLTADAKAEDPAWDQLLAVATECATHKDLKTRSSIISQLIYQFSENSSARPADASPIPAAHREKFKKLIHDFATSPPETEEELKQLGPLAVEWQQAQIRLAALAVSGTREQWIDGFNELVRQTRKDPAKGGPGASRMPARMYFGYNRRGGFGHYSDGSNPFQLPDASAFSLTSLPSGYNYLIRAKSDEGQMGGTGMDATELLKSIDRFESPLVRAWVAICAGDAAATEKALAVEPSKEEAADFTTLRAFQAIQKKNFSDAYRLLDQIRTARAGDRNQAGQLTLALVAVANEMKPEERAKIAESLTSVLVQCRPILGADGLPALAAKAKEFGFEELAARFQTVATGSVKGASALGPAAIGAAPVSGSSRSPSGSTASFERVMKLSAEKKNEAAAREVLLLYRQGSSSPYNSSNLNQYLSKLSAEVRVELLKIVNPGDSKSLTKRLEYADICVALNNKTDALKTLTELARERPGDDSIAAKMAFLLPPENQALITETMTRAATSGEFVMQVYSLGQGLSNQENNAKTLEFYETITSWLEAAPPESLAKANLSWVGYLGQQFFSTQNTQSLPDLMSELPKEIKDKAMSDRRIAVAKRLALAALRHPSTAEEGFRLLLGAKAWTLPPEELDAKAREALAALRMDNPDRNGRDFFALVFGNGGGTPSGGNLDEFSSVRWLTGRLAKVPSPDAILPPDYLKELQAKNPKVGEMVSALVQLDDIAQLTRLWESDLLKSQSSPATAMLRQAVLARAGTVPGGSKFFRSRLAEVDSKKLTAELQGNPGGTMSLVTAALTSAIAGKPEELDAVCLDVRKTVFGEKHDWDHVDDTRNQMYYRLNALENLFRQLKLEPAPAARMLRALYKAQIPLGDDAYAGYQFFRSDRSLAKVEDGEALFDAMGCLEDIATWEPILILVVNRTSQSDGIRYTPETCLLNEKLTGYLNMGFSQSVLVKRLRERKPATFGTLITAASMSYGKERSDLAAAAFAAAGPALAKLPADRLERLSFLVSWLPADSLAKLPPAIQKKARQANELRGKQLLETAREYLAPANAQNFISNPFGQMDSLLEELVLLDMPKAVELFLETERRYTENLSKGGRLNYYSSDALTPTARDVTLCGFMRSDDRLGSHLAEGLRFIAAVSKSPAGGRFSYADANYESVPLLGMLLKNYLDQQSESKDPRWLKGMKTALALPEEVRGDALIGVTCAEFYHYTDSARANVATEARKAALAIPEIQPALAYREVMVGVSNWSADTAEGKAATSKALTKILADATLAESSRCQLALAALTEESRILADPAIAESLGSLFEKYCEAERSAVNSMVISALKGLSAAASDPSAQPAVRRIHQAFWKNANSVKAGGHPVIPAKLASTLFLMAARVGDEATANKLLAQAKPTMQGDLTTICSLISANHHSLAKALLPDSARIYRLGDSQPTYSKALEESLKAFGAVAGDPLQFMRLECQLLQLSNAGGKDAPGESMSERSLRLAAAYQKNPPKNRIVQVEMLSAISAANSSCTLQLRDEFTALADQINFTAVLRDRSSSSSMNPTDPVPIYLMSKLESDIVRRGAMLKLMRGDSSMVEMMAKAIISHPEGTNEYSSLNAVAEATNQLCGGAGFWYCIALSSGEAAGFAKIVPFLEEVILNADGRKNLDQDVVKNALVNCQALALLTDQGDRFPKLLDRLNRCKNLSQALRTPDGFGSFAELMALNRSWNAPECADVRKKFLAAIFTRPSLAACYPHRNDWTLRLARAGLDKDLVALADPLPAAVIPEVRGQLKDYLGDWFYGQNKADQAIPAYRAARTECPPGPEYNELRAMIHYDLASALFMGNQKDEAKVIYETIPAADVGNGIKKNYQDLGKNLGITPVKP